MGEGGRTTREIADEIGVDRQQIKWWLSRYNKCQLLLAEDRIPKPKGRPGKDGRLPHQDPQKELERLRMENKLLRDFLRSTERT